MGHGMAEFLEKKVDSEKEWDKVSKLAIQEQLSSTENLYAGKINSVACEFSM